jgi:nucleotide-binding universal stress UspA family protein
MASSIVVGFDGSAGSRAALDTGVELAGRFGDPLLIVFGAGPPGGVGDEARAHRAAIEERGEQVTAEAVERARDGGVEVELVISHERPSEALRTVAAEREARFIVVGSRGEGPFRRAFTGSVPHKLLETAAVPGVVVRG